MIGKSAKYSYIILLLILAGVALVASGCKPDKKYRIGVSQCSSDDWREKMNAEIRREIMLHEDAEVEIRSADDDSRRQIEDIRYFKDNGFDILIVAPNEADALTPEIKRVYESGMPVVVFDRSIVGDSYTARIGADDELLGRSASGYARHLVKDSPKAIELYGLKGSTPAIGRHQGFVEDFEGHGGRLLASAYADWDEADALRATDSLLRLYPEIQVIFAHNDRMAIGASKAAVRLGMRDRLKIIGIDAAPDIGIRAVADSVIDATFLYPTEGHRIIRTALSILRGEKFDKVTMLPGASAVDPSNADILLLQDASLKEETTKMTTLKARIDEYWQRHNAQTSLFYASIAIILLLGAVAFILSKAYWQHKKYQKILEDKNRQLEGERDRQRQLNERLREATQSKLAFFTNVSHDLRTPLTLIAEPVSQLSSATNLTPRQHSLMTVADKNVRILLRLINQILDFRKFENGRLNLNLAEVNLRPTVSSWIESFQAIARKRDIKLVLLAPVGDGPICVSLDVEKMERVVFNLLSNAFKFTPDNGRVTLSYAVEDNMLTLSVADTGEGIGEDQIGRIFDRFYQVDQVSPRGSGIGLSLVKAFVELHGGSITVESRLGEGSVFTVKIPVGHVDDNACGDMSANRHINKETVMCELSPMQLSGGMELSTVGSEGANASETTDSEEKPVVLVIDDNADMRGMISLLLGGEYNVITASDGKEGMARASKNVPDLIICDVMMPNVDGLQFCRMVKEEVTTSHIPVLMLTACSLDEQRVEGFESGADGYLAKPFSADVLMAQCHSLIANRAGILNPESLAISKGNARKAADVPSPVKTASPGDIDSDFYRRFLEIFEAEMGNPELSVDSLASRMGLERSQFYRKIKALTNYAPVELMRRLRLERGHRMLLTSEKSVSEIAYYLGFSSPAYFTKCYREAYGETPSAARARVGK